MNTTRLTGHAGSLRATALSLLLCALHSPAAAQAASPRPAQVQGAPMLNITLLPYGTIVLADGAYYIPDFFGTGVAIYLQSKTPIRIATLEETALLKKQWAALPANGRVSAAGLMQAAQQAGFPSDDEVWGNWKSSAPGNAVNPVAVRGGNQTSLNSAPAKSDVRPAPTPSPDYLQVQFRVTEQGLTYRINNLSATERIKIDPASIRVYQDGQALSAEVTARDSQTGKANGELRSRAALIGTIRVQTSSAAPLTLAWMAQDSAGKTIPISFQWTPAKANQP